VKWRRSLTGGISIPERVLVVGEGPSPAADRPANTRPCPFPLAVERLSVHAPFAEQVEFTRRWRPTTLYAYPSWYGELLDHCERRSETAPAVRRLFTSSEVLTPATRARIEMGFRGRVFDVYGSTEFKEVAAECEYGRHT
jgi:phenylacetate-coenzyme A ligase PaaK-like adenylate-forming protein